MIEEAYVSFETAKLLKEKGFQNICRSYWRSNNSFDFEHPKEFVSIEEVYLLRPTQQMAMRWLREVYNIHIGVLPFDIELVEHVRYISDIYTISTKRNELRVKALDIYNSYEEAVETAICYALKNLIK